MVSSSSDVLRAVTILCGIVGAACNGGAPRQGASAQAVTQSPSISDFVLYGERSVKVGAHVTVSGNSGEIGVAIIAPTSFGPQVVTGQDFAGPNVAVLAPSLTLGANSNVGDVAVDAFQTNGSHYRSLATYPFSVMPRLPLAPRTPPGSLDVTIPNSTRTSLSAGAYAALHVDGTLFLSPGTYAFSEIHVGPCGRLLALGGGVDIHVAGTLLRPIDTRPRDARARSRQWRR